MDSTIEFVNRIAETWYSFVMHSFWQSALVGCVILGIVTWRRRMSATWRYGLLLVALVKFIVPPMFALPTGVLSQITIASRSTQMIRSSDSDIFTIYPGSHSQNAASPELHPASTQQSGPRSPTDISALLRQAEFERSFSTPESSHQQHNRAPGSLPPSVVMPSETSSAPRIGWRAYLMAVHVLGGLGVVAMFLARTRQLQRKISVSPALELSPFVFGSLSEKFGVNTLPRIVEANWATTPFSIGIFQPTVVVPSRLLKSLDQHQLSVVLLHEIAHHQRRDISILWLQMIVSALWWFHPVQWLITRALNSVREDCCDDVVLSEHRVPNDDYCDTLVKVAKSMQSPKREWMPISASMTYCQELSERLARIMDDRIVRKGYVGRLGLLLILVVASLVLPGLRNTTAVADPAQSPTLNAQVEKGSPLPIVDNKAEMSVVGRVIDQNGMPVKDALIAISVEESPGSFSQSSIAQASSDANGYFRVIVTDQQIKTLVLNRTLTVCLWIHSSKHRLKTILTQGELPKNIEEIALADAISFDMVAYHPQKLPFDKSKAEVSAIWVSGGKVANVPKEVRERLRLDIPAEGRFKVHGISSEELVCLDISTPDLGAQVFSDYRNETSKHEIQLLSVGSVEGQITLPPGSSVQRNLLRMRVVTLPNDSSVGVSPSVYGVEYVIPNADGSFRITAIAHGVLRFFVTEPESMPFRARPPKGFLVSAGALTRLDIPLVASVTTSGHIQDEVTKQPISGVVVHFQENQNNYHTITDDSGDFRIELLPKTTYSTWYQLPGDYITRNTSRARSVEIPVAKSHQLETQEFLRGQSLSGSMVDSDGKPMPGVQVAVDWRDPQETFGSSVGESAIQGRRWATTDGSGSFQVVGLFPNGPWQVAAARAGVRLIEPLQVLADTREVVALTSKPFDFVSIAGRVVDQNGVPAHKKGIQVYVNEKGTHNRDQVRGLTLTTDGDGRYQSPAHLPRNYNYRVSVQSDFKETASSKWFQPGAGDATLVDDIVVVTDSAKASPERNAQRVASEETALEVRVVDAQQNPIPNARIVAWFTGQRLRLDADSNGKAKLNAWPAHGGWIFVQAAGFRMQGVSLTTRPTTSQSITLTKSSDPLTHNLKTQTLDAPSAEILAFTRKQFTGFLESLMSEGSVRVPESDQHKALTSFARLDPLAAVQWLNGRSFDSWTINRARTIAASKLANDKLVTAIEIVDSIADPDYRANSLLSIAESRPPADQLRLLKQVRAFLDQSDVVFNDRIAHYAELGKQYRALSQNDQARQSMALAYDLATKLGIEGRDVFLRSLAACAIASVDTQKALRLLDQLAGPINEKNSAYQRLAYQLADIDSQLSEQLLDRIQTPVGEQYPYLDEAMMRVSQKMASIEPARAKRIADRIKDSSRRAYAIGLMADSIQFAVAKPKMIEEAYAILQSEIDDDRNSGLSIYMPERVAIALLPTVERVIPDQFTEYLWKTLALRRGLTYGNPMRSLGQDAREPRRLADPVLGAAIARYDLGISRSLTLTPGDESLQLGFEDAPFFLFGSLAILDPESAVRAISKMPSGTTKELVAQCKAWSEFASTFDISTEERWNFIIDHQFHYWRPGTPD